MSFRLYPVEQRWWSHQDYQAVLDVMARVRPKRVLEFGPGSSTLALVEGGAEQIDSCEDDPKWFKVYVDRLERVYHEVKLHAYTWCEPLTIPAIDGQRYDMALIDGPLGTERRPLVLRYALDRCDTVLMPTEECKTPAWMRPIIREIADEHHRPVEFFETGPLSGAFALVGAPC